ncbi:MAG TPA: cytochrome c biogenesis heme-transporting ATPase CcmA [Dokdonella sp.]|nr:cytochrome c biogenesis heme-transporting ATPase CcmA [Dokdonella sp.]HNS28491.1 cytochrome c biogenesis heme-transporting ATPase CcmA [Steroidobacteraceae bacterium]
MSAHRITGDTLHVFRGERHVLRGLSFAATSGEYLEVSGANGAGKTSLLRTIVGLVHAESGSVEWNGRSIHADPRAFHAQLAWLGHESPLKGDLSAVENLRYAIGIRRPVDAAAIGRALDEVDASRFAERPVRTLSAGQRRRVALAGVLLAAAPLWVLDEPATHLDAAGHALVGHLVESRIKTGGIVIAAVHAALPVDEAHTRRLGLSTK